MRRRGWIVLALVAFWVVGGNTAAHAAPFTPEVEAAYQEALAYWGGGEPPGCSSVTREVVPAAALPGKGGEATQPEPGETRPCVLRLSDALDACQLQAVVRHEVGHLFGHGHSKDPSHPMYEKAFPCPPPPLEPQPESYSPTAEIERALEGALSAHRQNQARCRRLAVPRQRKLCWNRTRSDQIYLSYLRRSLNESTTQTLQSKL